MDNPGDKQPGKKSDILPEALRKNIWKKGGPSPNPKGRPPKEVYFSHIAEQELNRLAKVKPSVLRALGLEDLESVDWRRLIVLAMIRRAAQSQGKESQRAAEYLWDRLEGKVPQTIQGPGGGPIGIKRHVDFSEYTDDELSQLRDLARKAVREENPDE